MKLFDDDLQEVKISREHLFSLSIFILFTQFFDLNLAPTV